ncbi:MAG TPA: pyridoxamine 5'-phosphate oxidase [Chthoniobacterales bacterium]
MIDPAELRREYSQKGIRRSELDANPIVQFRKWFEQALAANLIEPNAMTLSTASRDGWVSSRTVLLKAYDERGFVFFTNYGSRKAQELAENPHAALLFPWLGLERQVCVCGSAEKISTAESVAYFVSRPFGSRLGAWVSHQSKIISSRAILETKLKEMLGKFAQGKVPLPDFWGGYRVAPVRLEFWQGRPNRLHDRFQYVLTESGSWQLDRLSP